MKRTRGLQPSCLVSYHQWLHDCPLHGRAPNMMDVALDERVELIKIIGMVESQTTALTL
jgi:hypothetical protein